MKIVDDKIYLEVAELEGYGLRKASVYNGISANRTGKTKNWEFLNTPGQKGFLIQYDTIPITSIKKLPTKTQLLKAYLEEKTKEANLLEAAQKLQ